MTTLYRKFLNRCGACRAYAQPSVRYKGDNRMGAKRKKKQVSTTQARQVQTSEPVPRGIAEWTFNIIILIFATGTMAQPFVIPTSSMEDNLLVGDHLIVDRLAYAPAGRLTKFLLPYQAVKRGDIIVFRYPLNIKEDYVKRVIGVQDDRIRIVDKQVYLNGRKID